MSSPSPSIEKIVIDGPAGAIEAMIERPPGARGDIVAVCCHPHPLYGGTMQNKVVHTMARACQDQRVTTVRFNFRGVGASEGAHHDGAGESEDAAVVADRARAATGAAWLWSLGFSFGGFVAYRLATLRDASALVTVAPPVQRFDFARLPPPRCPWLVAQGDADELVDHERVLAWTRALAPAPEVKILPGAEHFFHGRLTELRALLGAWLGARAAENP
ncbi:MAG: alpha/beta hydrolase [Steroidobacteraceae bacterium]